MEAQLEETEAGLHQSDVSFSEQVQLKKNLVSLFDPIMMAAAWRLPSLPHDCEFVGSKLASMSFFENIFASSVVA